MSILRSVFQGLPRMVNIYLNPAYEIYNSISITGENYFTILNKEKSVLLQK